MNSGLCCGICRRKKLRKAEYDDRWLVCSFRACPAYRAPDSEENRQLEDGHYEGESLRKKDSLVCVDDLL